jgi:hypothetical protein
LQQREAIDLAQASPAAVSEASLSPNAPGVNCHLVINARSEMNFTMLFYVSIYCINALFSEIDELTVLKTAALIADG